MGYKELSPLELTHSCDISDFDFTTTADVSPLNGIIGQERAAAAMEFGLAIKRTGYNLYVSGLTGTGRSSYTKSIINNIASTEKTPDDWCYVYNFKNPDRPITIRMPAGVGNKLVRDMKRLIKSLKIKIPKVFEGEEYEKQKNEIIQYFQAGSSELMEQFTAYAKQQGLIIKKSEQGLMTIPIVNGKPMDEKDYMEMAPEDRKKLDEKTFIVQSKLGEVMKQIRELEKTAKGKIDQIETKIALVTVEQPIAELKERYAQYKNIVEYLQSVQKDIVHNIEDFKAINRENIDQLNIIDKIRDKDLTKKYEVNLIVDNKDTKGAPVVFDSNPKYYNLLGRIEYESNMGVVTTDFTKIKAGSIHAANGGYLIINISDISRSPESWEGLKRALKTNEIAIENIASMAGIISGGMKPEPIPIDLKVVMIGDARTYQMLYTYDEDFRKLFKIKADFDIDMDSSEDNIQKYIQFISSHCTEKGLLHFDAPAVCRLIEYSRRLADNKEKLSTRFNDIVEVLYEADAWARLDKAELIGAAHVKRALEQKVYRSNKIEKKLQELIDTGVILISTDGRVVGQVNGLAVMNYGDYSFGKPSRITATVYAGKKGIVNIEREVHMSGNIHDKGMLILSGYLGEKFAQEHQLSLTANICFEQLYDGVDGDSASSTELYALLSALSDVPIKQYIAVTGSVNQKGEIQPIGGVNDKIEGFYQTCKAKGLKGEEGVMIPQQNMMNLMLSEEVIDSVRDGKFHIYAVSNIEQGIEILTGIAAGNKKEDGSFEEGSIFYKVKEKMERFAHIAEKADLNI